MDTLTEKPVDRFWAVRIHGPLTMPCGAVVLVESLNQKCPNSGSCASGHKECWVFQVTEAS